jgi:hypothetical protein
MLINMRIKLGLLLVTMAGRLLKLPYYTFCASGEIRLVLVLHNMKAGTTVTVTSKEK